MENNYIRDNTQAKHSRKFPKSEEKRSIFYGKWRSLDNKNEKFFVEVQTVQKKKLSWYYEGTIMNV